MATDLLVELESLAAQHIYLLDRNLSRAGAPDRRDTQRVLRLGAGGLVERLEQLEQLVNETAALRSGDPERIVVAFPALAPKEPAPAADTEQLAIETGDAVEAPGEGEPSAEVALAAPKAPPAPLTAPTPAARREFASTDPEGAAEDAASSSSASA